MSNYRWKDKYSDYAGRDFDTTDFYTSYRYYISPLGTRDGLGTRSSPRFSNQSLALASNIRGAAVLSGGHYNLPVTSGGNAGQLFLIGASKDATVIDLLITVVSSVNWNAIYANNIHFNSVSKILNIGTKDVIVFHFKDCVLNLDEYIQIRNLQYSILRNYGSIFWDNDNGTITTYRNNNTYSGLTLGSLEFNKIANLSINYKCNIQISQSDLSSYHSYYIGFDNCNFRIGNETTYTPLVGTDEDSYRANFVQRCEVAGLVVRDVSDYGVTKKVGRWVFDNGSTVEGAVIKDSIFHKHEQRLFVTLGHTSNRLEQIKITTLKNAINSVSSTYANNLSVNENSIQLPIGTDITRNVTGYVDSGVIWLGGKSKINELNIFQNLRMDLGVDCDGTRDVDPTPISTIKEGGFYLVRSLNTDQAEITYNGISYSSSLITKNNIFVGVAGKTSFTIKSGNPVVYEVIDLAKARTIKMRIVDSIPVTQITSGNLQANYWYIVSPDNANNTSGTITYNSTIYPCYSSFLSVASALSFTKSGNVHLRRCWQKEYNKDQEVTDKAFWTNIQKPVWCDIVPNDPRCFMKNNYDFADEMLVGNDGNYLTSGHPDFYNYASGENGLLIPTYTIHGAFMQLRIELSTLNTIKI